MLIVLGTIGLSLGLLTMVYWQKIAFTLFLYTFYFMRVYIAIKRWVVKKRNTLKYKGKVLGNIHNWELYFEDKGYNILWSTNELTQKQAIETLDNRKAILYACLKTSGDDVMIELTGDLRMFYPFFFEDLPFSVFLRYIQANRCRSFDINEFYLSIYFNDNCFTEKQVCVGELWDKSFASVMTY